MKKILEWYNSQNIYIRLLPFLVFYMLVCILFSHNTFVDDEGRYTMYAKNLVHGFYSPPFPDVYIWSGPGYSIFLMPLAFLKLPYIYFRLLNPFLLYFSLILSYKSLITFSSNKSAFFYTIILGLYYPFYGYTVFICTETFSWFLISLICFLLIKCFETKIINRKLLGFTAFIIAYLAMTKIIFVYVILVMLFVSLLLFLVPLYRFAAKKVSLLFIIAFILCLPWLFYTYSLTHKVFYLTNCSGITIYTMSSPYENELGDYNVLGDSTNTNHTAFLDSVYKLKPIERDMAFREAGISNIKKYPKKYIVNWLANIGRLFFSMPFSNKLQSARLYISIVPNMLIVLTMFFVTAFSARYYKKIPFAIVLLFVFFSIYLFGSTLVSAYRRMFEITIPFWIILISYFFNNIVVVKLRNTADKQPLE